MATRNKLMAIFLIILSGVLMAPAAAPAQGVTVGFQVFYDELSPYGTWIYNNDYGYVWLPDVAPGFTPYSTNGYWVFTSEGWTWVSNYPWGWAPFHYGRWFMDPNYGAMWVPDNEWGPGWVTWRQAEGFYGWAPIGPGVSISVAYGNGYQVPYNQWTFVRGADFGRTNINQYYISNNYNVTIINSSTVINNTYVDRSRNVTYNSGPERVEVERRTAKTFKPVVIQESSRPGQTMNKNQLQIYRPKVERNADQGRKAAPARVERLENVKTSSERKAENPTQKVAQPTRQQPSQQQQPNQQQPKQQPQQQQPRQQQQQPTQQPKPQQQQPRQQPSQQQQPNQQQPKQQPQQQQPRQQPQQQQPRQQPQQPTQQPKPQQQQPRQQPQQQPKQQQQQQQPKQQPQQQPKQQQQPQQEPRQQQQQQQQQPQPKQQPQQQQQIQKQQQPRQQPGNPSKKADNDKEDKQQRPPKSSGE